jgi:hypothetical protein
MAKFNETVTETENFMGGMLGQGEITGGYTVSENINETW